MLNTLAALIGRSTPAAGAQIQLGTNGFSTETAEINC